MRNLIFILLSYFPTFLIGQTIPYDLTFGTNGFTTYDLMNDYAETMATQSDGKIIVGGSLEDVWNWGFESFLMRYNADGTVDNTFGNGVGVLVSNNGDYTHIRNVITQPDDKILVSIEEDSYDNLTLQRYNSDGTLDHTFGNSGEFTFAYPFSNNDIINISDIDLYNNGKILLTCTLWADTTRFTLLRVNANGTLDNTFGNNGVATSPMLDIISRKSIIMPTGEIITTSSSGNPVICKFTANGTFNNSFGQNGYLVIPYSGMYETSLTWAGSNRFLVTTAKGNNPFNPQKSYVLKFDSNGSPDLSFGQNGKFSHSYGKILRMKIQSDGKIVISSSLEYFSLDAPTPIVMSRYHTDGTLDLTFANGGVLNHYLSSSSRNYIKDFVIQSDGSIIGCGYTVPFLSTDGDIFVVKYLPNLSVDTKALKNATIKSNFFPNPISNENNIGTLEYQLTTEKNITISLYDLSGKLIKEYFSGKQSEGTYQRRLDFNNLPSNTYIINVRTESEQMNIEVIKG